MTQNCEYNIVEVDYWEKDAILIIEEMEVYFQFDGDEPTFKDAIKYLIKEVERQYDTR